MEHNYIIVFNGKIKNRSSFKKIIADDRSKAVKRAKLMILNKDPSICYNGT